MWVKIRKNEILNNPKFHEEVNNYCLNINLNNSNINEKRIFNE